MTDRKEPQHFNPTLTSSKPKESPSHITREELECGIAEFLDRGGKIRHVKAVAAEDILLWDTNFPEDF